MNLFLEKEKENIELIKLKENDSFDFIKDESLNILFLNKDLSFENNSESKDLVFNTDISLKDNIFCLDKPNIFKVTSQKKGRKKKEINKIECKKHDKFYSDNILRKIQCHYLNFIVSFINEILNILNYKQRLCQLDYRFKFNVNKKTINVLKDSRINEILCHKISSKYKMHDENHNIKIIRQIQNDYIMHSILSENYLSLFNNIYYKSKRIIDLSHYGLNKKITLSKNIKMYQDLINKNIINDDYKKKMNEIVIRNFISRSIFVCH